MACRGVHFAVEADVLDRLMSASANARVSFLQEEIEQPWDENWLVQTDKAWEAIHRSLTDGGLRWGAADDPLSNAILGCEVLYGREDYIICLVPSNLVGRVAEALVAVDKPTLRSRYFQIDAAEYGVPANEEDFEYTWENFEPLPAFFLKAAKAGRSVIFTADQ